MPQLPDLPVCDVLPELLERLQTGNRAVLAAPPGAGKTTIVPLSLLAQDWAQTGRIILVEPRRVATRAAARRMASLVDETVGATVGYAMRMDNRFGPDTRILVVTEGVFTRMALDDPELTGIAMVIFDEFHERSLDGDFGLALALDIASALRSDLKVLVMSATLDTLAVSKLIDGPVVESAGRSFPVEIRYRPRKAEQMPEEEMSKAIRAALVEEEGSCLAFLPGQAEIRRTMERLEDGLPASVDVIPLYGGLDGRTQDAAIRPAPAGRRKVVLATDIAESSITIDGVNIVIDSGLSRVPRFEPSTGLTRLETVRASRASVDQRAGRAGRTAPGVAIRLWHEAQTASLAASSQPEILEADLSGLLLDCASFGITDPQTLRLLDHPPAAAMKAARAQLRELQAIDQDGRLTATGKNMRKLPLPVRLAHMVDCAAERGEARKAAEIAVLIGERGLGGFSVDLDIRHDNLRRDKTRRAEQAKGMAQRLAANISEGKQDNVASAGRILLDACPDRVAKARGKRGHFVLANGRGAVVDEMSPLAGEPFIVVADMHGKAQNARISAAAAISRDEIIAVIGDRIKTRVQSEFDTASGSVRQRELLRLGAIKLRETALPPPSGDSANQAIILAVRNHGLEILPWDQRSADLRQRLAWLHDRLGDPWPDMSDDELLSGLDDWLVPFLSGKPNLKSITGKVIEQGLTSLIPLEFSRRINEFAPEKWRAPSGNHFTVRYNSPEPVVAVRVQELYGADRHPAIAGGSVPLKLELQSPANRPIQTTLDLPGFWRGSWSDVRKDMKSRYPKHVWPENPQHAEPTTRAKPRGK